VRHSRSDLDENGVMDEDLDAMNETELLKTARAMRAAIRAHRDSTGHDLCWHHPQLWDLLPDPPQISPSVPEWPQFMRGCVQYRSSLDAQLPGAPRCGDEFGS
jgi:hypothetical protein